jgi:signal transduction histidine kinase
VLDHNIGLAGESGSRRNLQVNVLPLAGDARVALVLSTPRALQEKDLRDLHRLASAGTLAASTTHEIKNALVAGKTFVDLLLEKNQDAELVEIVRREMERIDSLVSQLLQFSRPAKPLQSEVRAHAVLDSVLHLLQPQFKGKSISVERLFQAPSDLLRGEEQQLEQAFLNLFLNSIEAMGPGGSLKIETRGFHEKAPANPLPKERPGWFEITISDDGFGIAPEHAARLFQPFFSTKKHGTGLGLSITKDIVTEHGGEITAESQPAGATFRIRLPLIQPAA